MADLEFILKRFEPFKTELLKAEEDLIHSIHIVGSALTSDYTEGISDINSIVVLKEIRFSFVETLAPMGKKYKKHGIAAPLIMSPEYIQSSLDVFPVEFLNFKLLHHTVFGEDILQEIHIDRKHLRLQLERELKSRLVWLRQGYISTMGEKRLLIEQLKSLIKGFVPLLRAILWIMDSEATGPVTEVVKRLQPIVSIDCSIYENVFLLKQKKISPSKEELDRYFEKFYSTTESLSRFVDEITP